MTTFKWLPEQPTDEMVDAAMSSLPLSMPEIQVKQIYSLLWKASPEVEQDPVGYADAESITYLLEGGDSGILIVPVPTDTRDTPLYTHPPQRKPLSEEEIFNLFTQQNFTAYKIHDGTDHNDAVAVDRAFIDFVRAIEKAHGIGGT
jgi:hypothetical protein